MKTTLGTIPEFLFNGGTGGKRDVESAITRSFNQMGLLSALGAIGMFLLSFVWGFNIYYTVITLGIASFYFLLVLLNHLNRVYTSRTVAALVAPFWIFAVYICFGGFFSQSMAFCASAGITYISFQKHPRLKTGLLWYNVALYSIGVLIVNLYGNIIYTQNILGDEILIFWICAGWLFAVFSAFNNRKNEILQELKAKNESLEHTTEELEKFTYIASHDLKSPLRTITGFISLIEKDFEREKYSSLPGHLSFVKSGARQMNYLIQDILEISHLNTEETVRVQSHFDFNKVLEQVVFSLKEEIEQSNAQVDSAKLPCYYGHEAEFALLFQNIIQNGIKYNNSKVPKVQVKSMVSEDRVLLQFTDNGIGIPVEYREKVFELFSRLHNSYEYHGTGLGLGLCMKIIEKYQGSITIDDNLKGGSVFTVLLPLPQNMEVQELSQ